MNWWHVNEPVAAVCVQKKSNTLATVESNPVPTAGALSGPPDTDEMSVLESPEVEATPPIKPSQVIMPTPMMFADVLLPTARTVSKQSNRQGTVVKAGVVRIVNTPVSNTVMFEVGPSNTEKRAEPGVVTTADTRPAAVIRNTLPSNNVFGANVYRAVTGIQDAAAAAVSVGPSAIAAERTPT
jgi:hypothetical protein